MMDALDIRGMTKRYPRFALEQAGFTVRPGEIMGLIGRNGAGKSTLLKCTMGLVHPDAGEALFFGKPLDHVREQVAFVSGGFEHYPRKRLGAITRATRAFYSAWDDAAYARYLHLFALEEGKTPAQLSAGMRVKYSLALALSHGASLLILDEPTSGLDPISRDELLDVFLQLQRQGVSLLFSTHITADLEKCADRITYIRRGRVAESAPLADFTARYRAVCLPEEPVRPEVRQALIGLKAAKQGYTAIATAEDARRLGLDAAPATLDTIMVHLEKEDDPCEAC